MNIYICSRKIVSKEFIDFLIITDSILLMSKFLKSLRSSEKVDCADGRGCIYDEENSGSIHVIIFGKDKKAFMDEVTAFCHKEKTQLFNASDRAELSQRESVFYVRNKKIKECLDSIKDDYDIHKANWCIPKMASCIRNAENIVSGSTKVH